MTRVYLDVVCVLKRDKDCTETERQLYSCRQSRLIDAKCSILANVEPQNPRSLTTATTVAESVVAAVRLLLQ